MAVLAARGTELETDYPFGVVRQCLEPGLRAADRVDREASLTGAAALAAPVLLDTPSDSDAVSFGVLHGLYWLVANFADEGPLLLVVDDAQWVDEPSLRFMAYLARRIESLRATMIVAVRSEDSADATPGVLAELVAEPSSEMLTLGALGEQAVAELLRAGADGPVDDRFASACFHASGGNPFLLAELARELRDQGVPFSAAGAGRVGEITPPQVARATRARLARLGGSARALAQAIVVLGGTAPLELAGELAGLEHSAAARAADRLIAAGLLEPERPLRFRHPLLRSAVAVSLTLSESDASHRRAAALLRERAEPPERIAVHLLATAASGDAQDIQSLRDAAQRATARGVPDAAVPVYLRLLQEPLEPGDRVATLLELGRAEYVAGQMISAIDHLQAAYRDACDPVVQARVLTLLLQASSDRPALQTLAELIEPTIAQIGPDHRELALHLRAYGLLIWRPDAPTDEEVAPLDELPGDTPGEAILLGHLIFRRVSAGATAAEVAQLAERAARQADALAENGITTTAFSGVVLGLRWCDRLQRAEQVLDRAIAIARRHGSMLDFANALGLRAEVHVRRGLLREAEADARAAVAVELEGRWGFARGVNGLLQSLLGQGRADEAARTLDAELGEGTLVDVPPMLSLMLTRARVWAACGDHRRALAEFDEAVRRRQKWGGVTPSWIGDLLVAAESHHALGQPDDAAPLLVQARTLADRWGTPGPLGQVFRAQAMLGSDGDRTELLREAIALLERSPARLELARALIDLGGALRRSGYRSDSRDPLRRGYELARSSGAEALAEHARQELAASGVRVQRQRLTGAESLTPSERRIADMAADGASNAEIAQALFVTVKTVEMHLTHIYRKLDISGRSELTRALGEPAVQPET
jgi:DNA-binding CsgD family transcriptional regulator